jgi:hypothetical protein
LLDLILIKVIGAIVFGKVASYELFPCEFTGQIG